MRGTAASRLLPQSPLRTALLVGVFFGVLLVIALLMRGPMKSRAADCPQLPEGGGDRSLLAESQQGALAEGDGGMSARPLPVNAEQFLKWSEGRYEHNIERRDREVGRDRIKFIQDWFQRTANNPFKANSAFMFEVFSPTYPCLFEERIGTWLDGGKWVCRPTLLNSSSVVYSIGSDGLDAFEEELFRRFRPEIHVFDPKLSPRKKAKVQHKRAYKFHDVGISGETNEAKSLVTFQDIKEKLGHAFVDVLKMDCEHCEYDVIPMLLESSPRPVGQLLVEVHGVRRSSAEKVTMLLESIEQHGYRMFHVEINYMQLNSLEIAYIHESLC